MVYSYFLFIVTWPIQCVFTGLLYIKELFTGPVYMTVLPVNTSNFYRRHLRNIWRKSLSFVTKLCLIVSYLLCHTCCRALSTEVVTLTTWVCRGWNCWMTFFIHTVQKQFFNLSFICIETKEHDNNFWVEARRLLAIMYIGFLANHCVCNHPHNQLVRVYQCLFTTFQTFFLCT